MRRGNVPPPVGTLVYLMAGPIAWGLHFTLVYGIHVLLCLSAPGLVATIVVGVTVLAVAAVAAFLLRQRSAAALLGLGDSEWRAGGDRIARAAAWLSIVAVAWSGTAALVVDACAQAR